VPRRLRTLRLVSPFLKGSDVARVQLALAVPVDAYYGPVTASAAAHWKVGAGYPDELVDNALSPQDQRYLRGLDMLPAEFVERASLRAPELEASLRVPENAVAEMERWAEDEIRERPPGSDRVPPLSALARRLGVSEPQAGMGYPWCAFAALLAALVYGGRSAEAGLLHDEFNALYVPAILAEAQAGRFGLRVIAPVQAVRGDLALFDWAAGGDPADHLGRLTAPPDGDTVHTAEGNTRSRVALRDRALRLVRAFVRDS
jgi:hypothetical protein